ncbi:methionine-synthesizing 5-methyltetrahydropteroyltriglutamate--homocysteine methyltransferase [Saitoella coloradoensis]
MVTSTVLGFPRMGPNRELKKALEAHWAGKISEADLLATAKDLRLKHWKLQKEQGVDVVASNDFSLYDHVLDHSVMFNVIPERYTKFKLSTTETFFAMGRGLQRAATESASAVDVTSQEMVKWFDSNYHFMRPEFSNKTEFKLNTTKPVDEYLEAKAAGIATRPVLLGPVSFLYLGKATKDSTGLETISLLEKLLPVYQELLGKLAEAGAEWVQIDEPILVFDLPENVRAAYKKAYEALASATKPKIMFATYFGELGSNLDVVKGLPVEGIHVDLVRAPQQLDSVLDILNDTQVFSAGVVNGRNIWKTNLEEAVATVQKIAQKIGAERVNVAGSSSFLHTPHTLESETKLPEDVKQWFAFAKEKVRELAVIAKAVAQGPAEVREELEANKKAMDARKASNFATVQAVRERQSKVTGDDYKRKSPFPTRKEVQKEKLNLPEFPTTTIGSFPQTKEIRVARQKHTKGELSPEEYEKFIEREIQEVVKFQEECGLDVLVHGEPERSDMSEYFGQRLDGILFTVNGWVQSYGSRCVRPPIIAGDISRPNPMTVKESKYAQSLTDKPMKGMLTGPVTLLRWSFPRDDAPDALQAEQLALALRDEVLDLEAAGIYVIQVDEPALREGLPLRKADWAPYLDWAVKAFQLSTAGVEDRTQIHSHFCYSDFNDIFDSIKALDADVTTIENSKSDMKLLKAFKNGNYEAWVGPGVYDIHSPRVPSVEEIVERAKEMLEVIPRDLLWINPDCGLKTRGWAETKAALINLVEAAKECRKL